jgi:putative flippase GtrA
VPPHNPGDHPRSKRLTLGIFLVVGVLTAAIYYGLLALFLETFHVEYHVAVSFAYLTSSSFQFLMNRIVTFNASHTSAVPQTAKFVATAGVNYAVTLTVVTAGVEWIGVNPYWSVLLALSITTPLGFILSKKWVFGPNSP